jgi:hypothetical protein
VFQKSSIASKPPADAPMPTIGKLISLYVPRLFFDDSSVFAERTFSEFSFAFPLDFLFAGRWFWHHEPLSFRKEL